MPTLPVSFPLFPFTIDFTYLNVLPDELKEAEEYVLEPAMLADRGAGELARAIRFRDIQFAFGMSEVESSNDKCIEDLRRKYLNFQDHSVLIAQDQLYRTSRNLASGYSVLAETMGLYFRDDKWSQVLTGDNIAWTRLSSEALYAAALSTRGQHSQAVEALRSATHQARSAFEANSSEEFRRHLGHIGPLQFVLLCRAGRAEDAYRHSLKLFERTKAWTDRKLLMSLIIAMAHGLCLIHLERPQEAVDVVDQAVEPVIDSYGEDSFYVEQARFISGIGRMHQGDILLHHLDIRGTSKFFSSRARKYVSKFGGPSEVINTAWVNSEIAEMMRPDIEWVRERNAFADKVYKLLDDEERGSADPDVVARQWRADELKVRYSLLTMDGLWPRAVELARVLFAFAVNGCGRDSIPALRMSTVLALALSMIDEDGEASEILSESLAIARERFGAGHPERLALEATSAALTSAEGAPEERFDHLVDLRRVAEEEHDKYVYGWPNEGVLAVDMTLLELAFFMGKTEEARERLTRLHAELLASFGESHPHLHRLEEQLELMKLRFGQAP